MAIMNTQYLKKLSIKIMIGSLIAAAGLAVIAVLIGEINDVLFRALATLGIVALHALASLAYIGNTTDQAEESQKEELSFFRNTVFVILVLSFFSAVFGVWEVLPGEVVGKLYLTYGVLVFASLHGEMLVATTKKETTIDRIVYSNYVLMAIVIGMLLPLIWFATEVEFADFYYRLLAAAGIVDATLTILAVILHRMYLQKHPKADSTMFTVTQPAFDANGNPIQLEAKATVPSRRMHPLLLLLGIFIAGQILLSLGALILGSMR